MIRTLPLILGLLASTAQAKDPIFGMPLDCTLGQDCYINDYFDQDDTDGIRDYACGTTTRDVHRGVDFALFTNQALRDGVNVISVAPGTVRGVRNNMDDIYITDPNAAAVAGRECGNGVAVDHGGGWVTQYCHLKRDSITVDKGRRVAMGTPLGLVGKSGATSYPHLHFTTFFKGVRVDPFDTDTTDQCDLATANALWSDDIPYKPAGLIRAGFADTPPKFADLKDGQAPLETIPDNADALIAWVQLYAIQTGDAFSAQIIGPDGEFLSNTQILDKPRKLGMRFTGKNRKSANWPHGTYTATFTLTRDGQLLDTIQTTTEIQ